MIKDDEELNVNNYKDYYYIIELNIIKYRLKLLRFKTNVKNMKINKIILIY